MNRALRALGPVVRCQHQGGSLGGMLGAMNPMNLMPFGSEKEEKDADDQKARWAAGPHRNSR